MLKGSPFFALFDGSQLYINLQEKQHCGKFCSYAVFMTPHFPVFFSSQACLPSLLAQEIQCEFLRDSTYCDLQWDFYSCSSPFTLSQSVWI